MTSKKSEELNNLYRLYGVCVHHCANIEYRMGLFLHPVIQKAHKENIDSRAKELEQAASKGYEEYLIAWERIHEAHANIDKDIEKLDGLTLGQLIADLRKRTELSDEYSKYMADILEKRKYLIHKIWRKYQRLSDLSVIKTMTDELAVHEQDLRKASNWLREQACLIHGVISEQLMWPRKSFQVTGRRRANPSDNSRINGTPSPVDQKGVGRIDR